MPGGPTFGVPLPHHRPLSRERDFAERQSPLSLMQEGPQQEPPPAGPEGLPATPRPSPNNHRPPDARRPDGQPSPGRRRGEGRGRVYLREGTCQAPLPPGMRAALARQKESRARKNSGRARTDARARVGTSDWHLAAPAGEVRLGAGRSPLPSGRDGLMADRRGGRRSHRHGGERATLRCPVTTRGIAQGGPICTHGVGHKSGGFAGAERLSSPGNVPCTFHSL